jgi:hypothetical protein
VIRRTAGAGLVAAAAIAVLAPTCERVLPVRSADISTRDTELHLTVAGDAEATRWKAVLRGPAGAMELDDGDDLLVGGARMREAADGSSIVDRPSDEDAARLELRRPSPDESASVTVQLPLLPTILVAPEARRGEPLAIGWAPDPDGGFADVHVEGGCLPALDAHVPAELSSHTFVSDELGGEGGCEVLVTVTRLVLVELQAPPLARAPARLERRAEARFQLLP